MGLTAEENWMVVGTDGSPGAASVVRRAARLARATGASVHLVSAYRSIGGTGGAPYAPAFADERAEAEEILREGAEFVRAEQVPVKTHAVPGDPAGVLIAVAEGEEAQMIVVGDRGVQSWRRFVTRSVAEKVVRRASCSLLVVRTSGDGIVARGPRARTLT